MKFSSGLPETVCGKGSTMAATENVRAFLLEWIEYAEMHVVNDAGCGDMNWVQHLPWEAKACDYLGYDTEPLEEPPLPFQLLDISREVMRPCDLILCKDVFLHFPDAWVRSTLKLFKESGQLLMTSSYPGASKERPTQIKDGAFVPIDMTYWAGKAVEQVEYEGRVFGVWMLL